MSTSQTTNTLYDPARASRLMREAGIDFLLASRRANVAYLTDSFAVFNWEYPDVANLLEVEDDGCAAPHYFAGLPLGDSGASPFAVAHANRAYALQSSGCVRDIRSWCHRQGASCV